jgi:uncharacterized protein involved in exopolysaccharide biosynthesis
MGVVLLLAGIGLTAAGVWILLQQNEYASVAIVDVSPPPINDNDQSYNPYFFLTEFETIKSHGVLGGVSATLNLNELWGKKYNHGRKLSESDVEERIKGKLDLRIVPNTSYMQIKVYQDDPTESAKLANAIAQAYCDFRAEQWKFFLSKNKQPSGTPSSPFPKILIPATPQMQPVWPNRYLAAVMTGCGIFLMMGGIICLRRSGRNCG